MSRTKRKMRENLIHLPLSAGFLSLQLQLATTLQDPRHRLHPDCLEVEEAWSADNDSVVIRFLTINDLLLLPASAGPPRCSYQTSMLRYLKSLKRSERACVGPVWMALLMLVRNQNLHLTVAYASLEVHADREHCSVWPLMQLVDPDEPWVARPLPTHTVWKGGFFDVLFGSHEQVPFHLLAARIELLYVALCVILLLGFPGTATCLCARAPKRTSLARQHHDIQVHTVPGESTSSVGRIRIASRPIDGPPPPAPPADDTVFFPPPPEPLHSRPQQQVSALSLTDTENEVHILHRIHRNAPFMCVMEVMNNVRVCWTCPHCHHSNRVLTTTHGGGKQPPPPLSPSEGCRRCGHYFGAALANGQDVVCSIVAARSF